MKCILLVCLLVSFVQVAHGYSLEGPKYTPATYPYYINPANGDITDHTTLISNLKAASNKWRTWCPGVYKGTSTIHVVSFDGKNVVFFRAAKSGLAIATTYYFFRGTSMLGFDMVWWDAAWKFFDTLQHCVSGFYVIDVATHEFGHVIGMGHSLVPSATMFPSTVFCNTSLRTLAADDIAGATKLYP